MSDEALINALLHGYHHAVAREVRERLARGEATKLIELLLSVIDSQHLPSIYGPPR